MNLESLSNWFKRKNILPDLLTHANLVQLSRYLITGVIAFVVQYAFFAITFYFSNNTFLSNGIGMTAGFFTSFLLNRLWSFQSKSNSLVQLLMLTVLFLINYFITSFAIEYLAKPPISINEYISQPILMVLVVIWNFILYKKIIFK